MAQSPSIKREKWIRLSLTWLVVILVSVVIIYPLVWTVGAIRTTSSIPFWVTPLNHKAVNDPMEGQPIIETFFN